ncbi:MAG TPA: 1-deoxy-D-xylulose-5-phosphate reductoisomerase [Thermoguttaceae bacterium]|nr:1-deoxy-D-xylulose-5-phosphate reductoisomerase [Thermoguttaceae bacterium]
MTTRPKQIALLGSTGSIGRSTLEVVAGSGGRLTAAALSAHSNADLLARQAAEFRPRWIVLTDQAAAESRNWSDLPKETELLVGPEGVERIAADPAIDVVVSAIVGSAGLLGTWAALKAGKRVALANKESLVIGGFLLTQLARDHGAEIIPVDSEHSAVFQALQAGRRDEVRRVILTASGGPFRNHTAGQLADVTVAQALAHPTWEMGPKITVDSATMMNKALEIVEARWLFDLNPDQIGVVIHPQSVVHSIVEYRDGSMIAQLSPPDMKVPIQYALDWPERYDGVAARLDWSEGLHLDFEPADGERFAALDLGLEVARRGGTAGAVLSGANEAAVAAFLDGRLRFDRIVPTVRAVLENHDFDPNPDLDRLFASDRWARQEVERWIGA